MQDNVRSTAIKAVAKANNLELNIIEADTSAPTIEHLKANKLGKIPAFVGEDGFALSECIAIAIYGTFHVLQASRVLLLQLATHQSDDLAFLYSYPCLRLLLAIVRI